MVIEPRVGEPSLLFHEFIFLLSRIAITNVNTSGSVSGKLNDFFIEKLGFQRVVDIHKAKVTFDDIQRRIKGSDDEDGQAASDAGEDDEEYESEEFEDNENLRKLMEFLAKKAEEEKDFILDYDNIIAELDG